MSLSIKELSHLCWRCRPRWHFAAPARQTAPRVKFGHGRAQANSTTQVVHDNVLYTEENPTEPPAEPEESTEPFASRESPASWKTSARGVEGPGALAIFKSIIEEQRDGKSPGALTLSKGSLDVLVDISELTAIMEKYAASIECFQFFNDKIYPQIHMSSEYIPSIVKQRTALLFARIVEEKKLDCSATDRPRVARITEILVELGLFQADSWANLILQLAGQACRISTRIDDYDSTESHENAMNSLNYLLLDLWDSWRVLAGSGGHTSQAAEVKTNKVPVPTAVGQMHFRQRQTQKVARDLSLLFPHLGGAASKTVITASVATLTLLSHLARPLGPADEEVTNFCDALANTLVHVQSRALIQVLRDKPDLRGFISHHWESALKNAQSKRRAQSRLGPHPWNSIRRRLDQVVKSRNAGLAKETWVMFWGEHKAPSAERRQLLADCPDLFDYFILVFMSLRHPTLAVEVWNSMESIGISASLKTWTSMMRGCQRARNVEALHTVWEKLKTSGLQLDSVAWTARITALMDCRRLGAGLRALKEMALLWKYKDAPDNRLIAVEPTIEPVNAVLASLLRWHQMDAVKGVLAWAARQGIQPDIYTFNTLLRPMIRGGFNDEVRSVLQTMKDMEIEADSATYTILLDGTIGRLQNQTPEQQHAAVQRVIDDMETAGVEVNLLAYAKIIYLMLQYEGQTEQAIGTVLRHIRSKGLKISPHIYTMLAEHFVYQGPAGVERVAAMIRHEGLEKNKDIDRVFWERLIIAYCKLGNLEKAWSVYKKLSSSGAIIIYPTLHELLSALIVDGNWKAAAELVATAEEKERTREPEAAEELNLRAYRHRFWHLVRDSRLMSKETELRFRRAGQMYNYEEMPPGF